MTRLRAFMFAIQCFKMARISRAGVTYGRWDSFSCPQIAFIFARGRDAWQVSDFAAHYFGNHKTL